MAQFSWCRCFCRGSEGDQPNRTVRCRDCLILSECYLPDLPRSGRWRTILNSKMPSSPNTLRVQLAIFTKIVSVKNHNGLWDVKLAWYSPSATHSICRCYEGDQPYSIVRCLGHLILSEWAHRICLYGLELGMRGFLAYFILSDHRGPYNRNTFSWTIWLLYCC